MKRPRPMPRRQSLGLSGAPAWASSSSAPSGDSCMHVQNLFESWVWRRVRIEAEEAMGALIKFVFISKATGSVAVPAAFTDVPTACTPPVPRLNAPADTDSSPWLPFWWIPWGEASTRANVDAFIKAGVVILTAAPGSIGDWAGAPWTTHCWWAGEKDNGIPPPAEVPRILLADFRAVRGRGRDIIELAVLPGRHRVRQGPKIKLPAFDGELATYKTTLRLPALVALANGCPKLSEAEKEWFRNTCAAQSTGYRGVGEFLRDYSRQGTAEAEAKRWRAVKERVAEGKAIGPFDRPPFPNAACPHQAIVAYEFAIPKSKWDHASDAIRNINHASYPRGLSVNDLTPRMDEGVTYFTFAQHMTNIAKLGRRCYAFGGDIQDAYRQLSVRAEDLYQQIIAEHLPDRSEILFDNFVDNLVSEAEGGEVARERLQKLQDFFSGIGIELHEVFCGQQYSFLGWDIDTVRWLVLMPSKRMDIVLPRLEALAAASWTTVEDYASFKGLLTWLATVIASLRPLVGHMHECHAAMLRRGSKGGRASSRVQSGAAWAARLLERTEGAFSITDMQRTGAFNQDKLLWEGDGRCTTIWADANRCKGSQFGRAWLVVSDGVEQGSFLSEEWREEDEGLFTAESGEDAASRRELFNYLQAVWEMHVMTGCVRFCIVGDCAPACACIAKAHSPTPGMQAILDVYSWLFAERCISVLAYRAGRERLHIVDALARVEEAVGFLDGGLAYSTSRSYASGVNRLKSFADTFETEGWEIRWWEPDPALLVLFMTYIIGQISVGTLKVYLYGIRNYYLAHGQVDPLKSYHVERCWRGIKRSKKKGKDNRLTLTVDLLKAVVTFATGLLAKGGTGPRDAHDLIVLCTIMVWGVFGLFRIGELVVSGPKRYARVLRRMHCVLLTECEESFLCINLDGSKTDPFRGGLDVWLADLDVMVLSPVFWFRRHESSLLSVGLNRGKAQAMFRWADGVTVTRERVNSLWHDKYSDFIVSSSSLHVGRILATQEKKDEVEAKKIIREWKDHWQLIRTSKLYFYLKCVLAQEKFGVISLNIDGMDKAKTTVPNIGKSSGAGLIVLFIDVCWDTNLNLECLCRALNDQLIENRKKIDHQGQKGTGAEEKSTRANDLQFAGPDLDERRHEGSKDDFLPEVKAFQHVILQMDNTCKDNKNWILMSLLCAMVWFEVGGLETFEVGFMQVRS
eukprot:g68021.t1